MSVRLFAETDAGPRREHNEDSFLIADLTAEARPLPERECVTMGVGPRGALFAVCDGMGGAAAGQVASRLAVDALYECMAEGEASEGHDGRARRLVRAIEAANARIYRRARDDRALSGMGAAVTAASLVGDRLFLGQVGETRGYVMRGGRLTQATRDQSPLMQLVRYGALTEEEAETCDQAQIDGHIEARTLRELAEGVFVSRDSCLQALGVRLEVQAELTFVELRRDDTLLLCSDGLSSILSHEELRDALGSHGGPLEACRALVERAHRAGGPDNITCIVARFEGEGLKPPGEGDELTCRKYAWRGGPL